MTERPSVNELMSLEFEYVQISGQLDILTKSRTPRFYIAAMPQDGEEIECENCGGMHEEDVEDNIIEIKADAGLNTILIEPYLTYLRERQDTIKAVFIKHGLTLTVEQKVNHRPRIVEDPDFGE